MFRHLPAHAHESAAAPNGLSATCPGRTLKHTRGEAWVTLATEAPTQRTRSEGLADFPFLLFPPFARQLWLTRLGVAPSYSLEVFALGRAGCQGGLPLGAGRAAAGQPPRGGDNSYPIYSLLLHHKPWHALSSRRRRSMYHLEPLLDAGGKLSLDCFPVALATWTSTSQSSGFALP